jgi:hypothetical protein
MKECSSHKPLITQKNLENVFSNKTIMNDRNSRGFLIRLEKARFENEDKTNRVYWNPRGSSISKTSHYSNNLTLPNNNNLTSNNNNTNSVKSLFKQSENKVNLNNSILNTACGTDEKNKNSTYNLNDTKRNLKTELLNIECLTIKTESDQE